MDIEIKCSECNRSCDEVVCEECYKEVSEELEAYRRDLKICESDLGDAEEQILELKEKINNMIDMPHMKFLLTKETMKERI